MTDIDHEYTVGEIEEDEDELEDTPRYGPLTAESYAELQRYASIDDPDYLPEDDDDPGGERTI